MASTTNIEPNTTMQELLDIFPGARRALFKKYHIGGCSSCGFQPAETITQVCERNQNLPVDDVISFLHASHEEDLKLLISPLELNKLRRDNTPVKLLDIRTREEFDATHIDGSVLFTQELMQDILSNWDRKAAVVIVDHQGTRSLDAAAYFVGHGFENIRALQGGIDAWSIEVDANIPRYHLE